MLQALLDRIEREGPVRFDVAMDALLYGEGGFFAGGGGAGRRGGDFLTSPEVGPLFGAVVARALDAEWERLGRPDPFVVIEAGAGRGVLAKAVLAARPACLTALRYVLVERSAALRAESEALLPVEPASSALGPAVARDDPDDELVPAPAAGPVVSAVDALPLVTVTGVVLANELLDNLPFRILERTATGWDEVLVAADGETLRELSIAAPPEAAAEAAGLAPTAPVGARIPLQHAAREWVRDALGVLEHGRLVVIDYAVPTTASLLERGSGWLRTFRDHGRGGHPLEAPGGQDITTDVAVDQLPAPSTDRGQADWLRSHGLDELVAEGRRIWEERAALGDLEAVRARSRIGEAEALTDPAGLGAFRVLEWVKP